MGAIGVCEWDTSRKYDALLLPVRSRSQVFFPPVSSGGIDGPSNLYPYPFDLLHIHNHNSSMIILVFA